MGTTRRLINGVWRDVDDDTGKPVGIPPPVNWSSEEKKALDFFLRRSPRPGRGETVVSPGESISDILARRVTDKVMKDVLPREAIREAKDSLGDDLMRKGRTIAPGDLYSRATENIRTQALESFNSKAGGTEVAKKDLFGYAAAARQMSGLFGKDKSESMAKDILQKTSDYIGDKTNASYWYGSGRRDNTDGKEPEKPGIYKDAEAEVAREKEEKTGVWEDDRHGYISGSKLSAETERRNRESEETIKQAEALFGKVTSATKKGRSEVRADMLGGSSNGPGESAPPAPSAPSAPPAVSMKYPTGESLIEVPTGEVRNEYIGPAYVKIGDAVSDLMMTVAVPTPENDLVDEAPGVEYKDIPEGSVIGPDGSVTTKVRVPPGAIVVDGGLYMQRPVMRNRLHDLSPDAKSWSDEIQLNSVQQSGRTMDKEVAAIRAMLKAGEIETGEALAMAWELRQRRDRKLAETLAEQNGGTWSDYYVPTDNNMLKLSEDVEFGSKVGREFVFRMNAENNVDQPELRTRNRRKNLYLAHRLGLAPALVSTNPEDNTEEVVVDKDAWRKANPGMSLNEDGSSVIPPRDVSSPYAPPSWEITDTDPRSVRNSERLVRQAEFAAAKERDRVDRAAAESRQLSTRAMSYLTGKKLWDPKTDGAEYARLTRERDLLRKRHKELVREMRGRTVKATRRKVTGMWVLPSDPLADHSFPRIRTDVHGDLRDVMYNPW